MIEYSRHHCVCLVWLDFWVSESIEPVGGEDENGHNHTHRCKSIWWGKHQHKLRCNSDCLRFRASLTLLLTTPCRTLSSERIKTNPAVSLFAMRTWDNKKRKRPRTHKVRHLIWQFNWPPPWRKSSSKRVPHAPLFLSTSVDNFINLLVSFSFPKLSHHFLFQLQVSVTSLKRRTQSTLEKKFAKSNYFEALVKFQTILF